MGFLGTEGKFIDHPNEYVSQLANLGYEMGPARKYYKGILKGAQTGDYRNMPGMGMFDQQIASGYKDIDNQADPLAFMGAGEGGGAMGDRIAEINKEKLRQGVNSEKAGFAQNQLQGAAGGLAEMWSQKNQFNLNKLQGAGSLENQRYQYQPPQQGWGSGLLNSAISGGASVAGAFAGKPPGVPCDARLKENIYPYDKGLDIINQMEVKEFDYNANSDRDGDHAIGPLAHEVAEFAPQMVVDIGGGYQGIDQQTLIFTLVNSVKELSAQVKDLQSQLAGGVSNR